MALVVQKYGGTSVATPERIRSVARRIRDASRAGTRLVVVVSAMGHTTDELLALARQVSRSPSHRETDMLLTAGERISMALLCMALADLDVDAVSYTGSQTGIVTDSSHRRARIRRILGDRVRRALEDGRVVIVAGFQGVSEEREITTLGRGGSDTTAVALAVALGARECQIYTDVEGVYTADPRIAPGARLLKTIAYDEMLELAAGGAGVLHPRSVALARKFGVRLKVLSSLEGKSDGGTALMKKEHGDLEGPRYVGVTADEGLQDLVVELARPSVMGALWDQVSRLELRVFSPVFEGSRVRLYVERDCEEVWRKHLEGMVREGFAREFRFDPGLVPLSVVGECLSTGGLGLSQVVQTLSDASIPCSRGSASALSVTVAIGADRREDAIREIHSRLIDSIG